MIRTSFKIPISGLLPYGVLVAPIAYCYHLNDKKELSISQIESLTKYFFRSSISHRFSSSVESALNFDIKVIEKIKNNEDIDWNSMIPIDNTSKEHFEEILKKNFSASNAFDKAILCIMAYAEPKNLKNNASILLDNSHLSQSNSKNYHHFFPKAYLKRQKNDEYANALANIIFTDNDTNKYDIQDKAPNDYLKEFFNGNPELKKILKKAHFIRIGDNSECFINSYEDFLKDRVSALADEIIKRI